MNRHKPLTTVTLILAAILAIASPMASAQDFVDSVDLFGASAQAIDSLELTDSATINTPASPVSNAAADSADSAAGASVSVFNNQRWYAFALVIFFSLTLYLYTRRARQGKKLFIRKIPGLEAVEEAVGRATEMGRTVLFIPGIQELDEIQTIAGVTILGRVARITAEYDTPLVVPVRYPLVYAGAQEMVEQSYVEMGRKDSYNQDMVRYVAGEQFAFTAHVNGWMVRERPAANIYMGAFFAESLLLAETGFAAGAIQIAGTAEVAQLPFFIAACDYTLIGEELYAGTAYLSQEPLLLGGLKGQDFVKVFLLGVILVGVAGVIFAPESLGKWLIDIWTAP
ncbi:MAG TPA: DUF6754 domain-containing protein [candidate division Zixibacteria bacterium]|nr:DUF6754 domain-containing protein [candidate division Zixibacteria bacterium]